MTSPGTSSGRSGTVYRRHPRIFFGDLVAAVLVATVVSGLPSTLFAVLADEDAMAATRAAGAMLVDADSPTATLVLAAALVHTCVSFFWGTILIFSLPRTHVVAWSVAASAAIAVLDLRVIGSLFPEVHALPFWPQFADHLMWGASFGAMLRWRSRQRPPAARTFS